MHLLAAVGSRLQKKMETKRIMCGWPDQCDDWNGASSLDLPTPKGLKDGFGDTKIKLIGF
jgi:hypothetical protein